jgi:HEAT repeat protein
MKNLLLAGSVLAVIVVFGAAYYARTSETEVVLASLREAEKAPNLGLQQETAQWRAEFLDRATDLRQKCRLLGLLSHGQGPNGEDPRSTEVVNEALWLIDHLTDPERREDVLVDLRGVASEAVLLKALELLSDDEDREVRGDAARLLATFDDKRATEGIEWARQNDESHRVREDCAEALAARR